MAKSKFVRMMTRDGLSYEVHVNFPDIPGFVSLEYISISLIEKPLFFMAPEIGYQRIWKKEFKEAVENGGMKGVSFRKIDENLKYQSKVFNTLSAADASGGKAAVENALKNMGELMRQGNF